MKSEEKRVVGSLWISVDKSISAWKPRTTDKGGLPNISFIIHKPTPLGTEFKSTACPITGVLRCLEIRRGKQGMAHKKYNSLIGATAGCTLRLAEEKIAEDDESERHGVHGDAWFGSVKTASELATRGFECMKTNNTISEVSAASSDILLAANKKVLKVLVDVNGGTHSLMRYDIMMNPSGRKRALARPCKLCLGLCEVPCNNNFNKKSRKPLSEITTKRRDAGQYCYECGVNMAFCHLPDRDCFQKHVLMIKRKTRFS
jgi:hypothetical protein